MIRLSTNVEDKNIGKFAKALFKENQELRQKLIDLEDKIEHLEQLLLALPVQEIKG